VSGADTSAEIARRDVARAIAPPAYGRWLATAAIVLIAGWFAWIVATNPNFEWPVVVEYFTARTILRGLGVSLGLTVVAMTRRSTNARSRSFRC
jgi:polar amino acid transport system permease protein